ncbi:MULTISPECIES: hypothetical protein [unclassified Meridianimarinicoccus]|uniref:hypothetical protein n=1 Tax=unclassified Meridianimarinicoccus TaxID=2923344 RepID=UPI0018683206|nr:hypothetical protein [Fluviibacterium sp. MJW13]
MKFSHEEEIAVSRAAAFAGFSDLDRLISAVVPGDMALRRQNHSTPLQPGATWQCDVTFHGLQREVTLCLDEITPPDGYALTGRTSELKVKIAAGFAALAADLTLARFDLSVRPCALSGHMLMPPLHLLRPRIEERLVRNIAAMARALETPA